MKICKQCGNEITNGINGCMLMGDICFDCGGKPQYISPPIKFGGDITEDEMKMLGSLSLKKQKKCVIDLLMKRLLF
jgi:hypothetical protein